MLFMTRRVLFVFALGMGIFFPIDSFSGLPSNEDTQNAEVSNSSTLEAGKRLLNQQKWEQAAQVFGAYLNKEPKSAPAAVGVATALIHLGKREEALNTLVRITLISSGRQKEFLIPKIRVLSRLFLTNKTIQIHQEGFNRMLAKNYRAAQERFEKALAEESDNAEILLRLGQCQLLEGNFRAALEKLKMAKKVNPYEPVISLWLGRALHQSGKLTEALEELKVAYRELPGSEIAPLWLAETTFLAGQTRSAIHILEKDVKEWPFHLQCLTTLARLRLNSAHPDSHSLWAARKDLQLAMSRLDQVPAEKNAQQERELSVNLRKSPAETKGEIQRLTQIVQSRLDEISER
jgi:tetratricopeptide (TPR) repeat protein